MSLRYYFIVSVCIHALFFAMVLRIPLQQELTIPGKPIIARLIKPQDVEPQQQMKAPPEKPQRAPLVKERAEEVRVPRKLPPIEDKEPPKTMDGIPAQKRSQDEKQETSQTDEKEAKPFSKEPLQLAEKKAIEKLTKDRDTKLSDGEDDRQDLARNGEITFSTKEYKYYGYKMRLKEKIEGIWQYPHEAASKGIYGDLFIKFTILKSGKLGAIELLRTSGYKMLDAAAMKALRDAAPFWPLPDEWQEESFTIKGHFVYSLHGYYIR